MSQILLGPVITEKSMSATASGKYVFKVDKQSNKSEIVKEVEKTYKVKVKAINIINIRARQRRFRFRQLGQTAQWKKAIVTLQKGQRIKDFEIKEEKKKKEK